MKFIVGFFFGLMTGVTIILAPLIAVLVALGFMAQKDENENVTIVNNLPENLPEADLSATPE